MTKNTGAHKYNLSRLPIPDLDIRPLLVEGTEIEHERVAREIETGCVDAVAETVAPRRDRNL
jgi:hypothetical protein